MRLRELLKGVKVKENFLQEDVEINGLSSNSKKVKKGWAFFAITGTKLDGKSFIEEARKRGARVIITDERVQTSELVIVEDAREAYAVACSNFFSNPSEKLELVFVTGTNGKTTSAYLMNEIMKGLGEKSSYIGTLGAEDYPIKINLTTPDPYDFQDFLNFSRKMGKIYIFAEASSHSLHQKRIWGTHPRGCIFMNLSRDHLDYHHDMESYFSAKASLFTEILKNSRKENKFGIINIDDEAGKRLFISLKGPQIFSISLKKEAHATGEIIDMGLDGMKCRAKILDEVIQFKTKLTGGFNLFNILCALLSISLLGKSVKEAGKVLAEINPPPGRLEKVEGDLSVYIDYAHTPDALEKVLHELRKLTKGRLILAFGCGGDRDRGKRPEMGEIAWKNADVIIITSDNPRSENPISIIEDILRGIPEKSGESKRVYVEPDRKKAIKMGIELMDGRDIFLIAGKGHEDYQIIGEKIVPFSDREIARNFVREKNVRRHPEGND